MHINKLIPIGYIFIFLSFIFLPWLLNGGFFNEEVDSIDEASVPYFQTNTCDFSINSILGKNFFNDKYKNWERKMKLIIAIVIAKAVKIPKYIQI